MERITYIEIVGKEYPMSFSLGASKKIIEKYGNTKKMETFMKREDDDMGKIDAIVDIVELLIAQGCAYKNFFEPDVPAPENAPIVDGKWTPLPREALEIAIGVYDIEEITDKIVECVNKGNKKTVKAEPAQKNVKATQG